MTATFINNTAQNRFELNIGNNIAFADYRIENKILFINYVEAPPELRGTGAAGNLMAEICAYAKKNDLSITPICSYAAAWLRRHAVPE